METAPGARPQVARVVDGRRSPSAQRVARVVDGRRSLWVRRAAGGRGRLHAECRGCLPGRQRGCADMARPPATVRADLNGEAWSAAARPPGAASPASR